MKTKRVLVTGGAGFIGSHIVDGYLALGCEVVVVDDLSTGDRANVNPDAQLVVADLRDPASLGILDRGFDLVNHQAAQIDVRKSVVDPAWDAELNVVASIRLFRRCADLGVAKVVFASSGGAAYGEPVHVPQTEDHPVAPMSPYGCAKVSVEHYLRCFQDVHGLHFAALRYANVYGPRQSTRGEAGVIAIFTGRMLAGEGVVINGSGEQTRDYVFVEDVVRANMAVSTSDLEGAFNVGTGVETSVNQLAGTLRAATGFRGEIIHGPAKAGEQMRSVLDGTRLRHAASLPPTLPLDDGLARTVEWFASQ